MSQSLSTPLGERMRVNLLRITPLRAYSRAVRLASAVPLPRWLRGPVFGRLAAALGMDLGEAEHPVEGYRSFQALFVRRLATGARSVDLADDAVVSPVDACVSASGVVSHGALMQAKGIDYSLAELVADETLAQRLEGGFFATLYLRPRDYHRIHCPLDATLTAVRHLPGTLFPVQPHVVRNLRGLFVRNERVVLELAVPGGVVAMVCVAATGVGNITTFQGDGTPASLAAEVPLTLQKGQEVAAFNLGSTVVLVFSAEMVTPEPLELGQEVRMGQRLVNRTSRADGRGQP